MTIYSGQLKSHGSSSGSDFTYVEIGATRIRNVKVPSFIADFISRDIGNTISISGYRSLSSFYIAAIKRENGEVIRLMMKEMIPMYIAPFLAWLLLLPIPAFLIGRLFMNGWVGLFAFAAGYFLLAIWPMMRSISARSAF